MSAPVETELKFLLTRDAAERLKQGEFADAMVRDLASLYYDTEEGAIWRAGYTLRLRRTGGGWVQTLKGRGPGLSRFEDEAPAPERTLDEARLKGGPIGKVVKGARLTPQFETRVRRRTRLIEAEGAVIELALDEGEILAGLSRQPILELELELKSGRAAALFAQARRLSGEAGLRLSLISKSERGHALAAGRAGDPVKYRVPSLRPDMPTGEAFRALIFAALYQLEANAALLAERPSIEAVHQARVGLRRLMVLIAAFGKLTGDAEQTDQRAELKRLTGVFADARSLDVFIAETFRPFARHDDGMAEFGRALLAAQSAARDRARAAVADKAFAAALLGLVEWISIGRWSTDPVTAAVAERPIRDIAASLLRHRWSVFLKRGAAIDWHDPFARHKLRIQAKKMRYLADGLAPLFGGGEGLLQALERFQDLAGRLNDIATAPDTAALAIEPSLSQGAVFAAGHLVGERRAETKRLLRGADAAFQRLTKTTPFWPE